MSQVRLKILAGAVVLLSACSGGSDSPVESAVATEPSLPVTSQVQPSEDEQEVPDNVEPGLSRIEGEAWAVSDVQTQPDHPMPGGFLVVLPVDNSNELWDLIGEVESHQLPYTSIAVEEGDLPSATRAPIVDGVFSIELANGEYQACRINDAGTAIQGCAAEVTTVAGSTTWTVRTGEGGFELLS